MSFYDIKLYTGSHNLIAWRDEYATVWDAVDAAHLRAEKDQVEMRGLSALLVAPTARQGWTCVGCSRVNPSTNFACDGCGQQR